MPGPPKSFASLLRARRGYLGTVGPDGAPGILPVCFTWAGEVVWTTVDSKTRNAKQAQRFADIKTNPRISFMVDRWDEDWTRLAWLQAIGTARTVAKGAESTKALTALKSKYAQYRDTPAEGPVIRIDVERWISWSAGT